MSYVISRKEENNYKMWLWGAGMKKKLKSMFKNQ